MSFLVDRDGRPWDGDGLPTHLLLKLDDDIRAAVRLLPATVLVEVWAQPWLSRGIEPPPRTITELRRELEARARQALKDAPTARLVPISVAAREWAIPERTLRARIAGGALETRWNGRGELALELPVTMPVRVPLPRSRPDPRILMGMARDGCQQGEQYCPGYTRRRDGEAWRTSW